MSLDPSDLSGLAETVEGMLGHQEEWAGRIVQVTRETVFNLGSGAEAAGEWVLGRLLEKQSERGADAA